MNNGKNTGPDKSNEPKKPEVKTRQEPQFDSTQFVEVKHTPSWKGAPRIHVEEKKKETTTETKTGYWKKSRIKKWTDKVGESFWERSKKIMSAVGFTVAWLLWGVFLSQADTRNVINKTVSNVWNALGKEDTVYAKEQGFKKENAELKALAAAPPLVPTTPAIAVAPSSSLPIVKENEKSSPVIDKPKIAYTLEWTPVAIAKASNNFKKPIEAQLIQTNNEDVKVIAENNQKEIETKLKTLLELQGKKPLLKEEGLPTKIANYNLFIKKQERSMKVLDAKIAQARDQKMAKVIEEKSSASGSSGTSWTSASGSQKAEWKTLIEKKSVETLKKSPEKSKTTASKVTKNKAPNLSYASLKKLVSEADVAGGKYSLVEMSKRIYRVYFITDSGRKFYFTANLPSNRRYLTEDGIISWGEKKAEIARGKETSKNSKEKKSPILTKETGEAEGIVTEIPKPSTESVTVETKNKVEDIIPEYSSANEQFLDARLWKNKPLINGIKPIVWANK